jgi:hypothetical protein
MNPTIKERIQGVLIYMFVVLRIAITGKAPQIEDGD